MTPIELLILGAAGLFAGTLAGFLGVGGGVVLVPLLLNFGYEPVQAFATSSLSIVITAFSGSIQNWRMGYLNINRVLSIGFSAALTAQIGTFLANEFPRHWLLFAFGCLLLVNIYLVEVRQRITAKKKLEEAAAENLQLTETVVTVSGTATKRAGDDVECQQNDENGNSFPYKQLIYRVAIGSVAGLLAGFLGVGGGLIMVPMQILLLNEAIKVAIQTSLGVIVITGISACAGHALRGNVFWLTGIVLGCGGLLGTQLSTRFLPKLSEKNVTFAFRSFLAVLSVYFFWRAWQSYSNL